MKKRLKNTVTARMLRMCTCTHLFIKKYFFYLIMHFNKRFNSIACIFS